MHLPEEDAPMSMRSEYLAANDGSGLSDQPLIPRERAALLFQAVCVISAFLIRYFSLPQNGVINGDGVYYASLGSRLISGNISDGISAYWSPLYSLLLGVAYLFTNELEMAGRLVSLVAGSLLIVPAYILLRNFFGKTAAYIGAILVVVHPLLITSSGWVMTESLYILIFTTTVICGWFALENGRRHMFLLTGCLFGAAFLTKPESIGFVVLFSLLVAVRGLTKPGWEIKRTIAAGLIFLVGFAIFFLPYVVFIHSKTGRWTVSQKFVNNSTFDEPRQGMLKLTKDGSTTMQDRIWWDNYEAEARVSEERPKLTDPSAPQPRAGFSAVNLASKIFNNLSKELREYMRILFPIPFIFIGAIGFITAPWTRERATKDIYLLSFVACTFLGYAATVTEVRYFYVLIPIFVGWVALGCVSIGWFVAKHVQKWRNTRWITPVAIQVLLLLLLFASLVPLFSKEFQRRGIDNVSYEEKAAGLWLRHNSDPHSIVMAANATVAFYADAAHIFLPDEDVQTVREYADRKKVDYIVLSERRLKNRQDVYKLSEREIGNVKLIYEDNAVDGYNVKIYKILE